MKEVIMRRSILGPIIAAGLSLALACGKGGSDPASTPDSSNTSSSPAVQAVVGGTEDAPLINQSSLVTTGASVTLDGMPASASSVQPGVILTGTTTENGLPSGSGSVHMKAIHLHSSFVGALQAIDTTTGSLTVMDQAILVDTLTHFAQENEDGSHTTLTLADFATGDFVRVFGFFKADGSFLATRVEKAKPGTDTTLCGVSGTVSSLDTTAKTFTLGTWTIAYATAEVGGTLADGAFVRVRGTVADATLTATIVNVAHPLGESGCHAALRGRVQNLDTEAKTFQLMDLTINYAPATVIGTLAEDAMVEVQGSLASTSTTVLDATRVVVTIRHRGGPNGGCDGDRQVKGAITALDLTAGTLTVSETTFWFDASTVILSRDAAVTPDQLAVGNWVAVLADTSRTDAAGNAYAARIDVIPTPSGAFQLSLMGPVESFDATAQTLVIHGFTVTVTAETLYASQGASITAEAFWSTVAADAMVEACGTIAEGQFTASRIILGTRDGMGPLRH
jgi:hypothetical protein